MKVTEVNPAESLRTYSTPNSTPGYNEFKSMIDSENAWDDNNNSDRTNNKSAWMVIDRPVFDSRLQVVGIVVQSRNQKIQSVCYVKTLKVEYSNDNGESY